MTDGFASALQHLYVHVPFCSGKCHYCGFHSVVADAETRAAYAPLPGRELQLRLAGTDSGHPTPRTLYCGGGTPALLGLEGLRALAAGLRATMALDGIEEWTMELNPAGVTRAFADDLRCLGVNRVSLGAQCFDDDVLRAMGRRHNTNDSEQAVRAVREAGFENIGLDLIAGLPGMTPERWRVSVARTCDLGVAHLSVYALSVEAGTELARRVAAGTVALPDTEAQLEALAVAERLLGQAGFTRYEISNYARPGSECRHNLACWRGEDYIGLGPSAASRVGLRRWTNQADLETYTCAVASGSPPPCEEEALDPEADVSERFVFGLRLGEGVQPEAFVAAHPAAAARLAEWNAALARLAAQDVVERGRDGAWRLTVRGREVADAAITELV